MLYYRVQKLKSCPRVPKLWMMGLKVTKILKFHTHKNASPHYAIMQGTNIENNIPSCITGLHFWGRCLTFFHILMTHLAQGDG